MLDRVFGDFGLTYEMVDTSDLNVLESKISPQVKGLLIESPANPLLTVTDIAAAAAVAHRHGLLTIVDNTFVTPYLQRPLMLGADVVVHSATKYLGGHSDLVAGDETVAKRLGFIQNATGGVLEPFDSWLLIRGIKTLPVRMDRHQANALAIARFLQSHPGVERVYYPGLPESDGYAVQSRQASGAGGIVSFVLSDAYDIRRFFRSVRLVTLGESLGSVESLVCHPASMTHASIPPKIRRQIGIADACRWASSRRRT